MGSKKQKRDCVVQRGYNHYSCRRNVGGKGGTYFVYESIQTYKFGGSMGSLRKKTSLYEKSHDNWTLVKTAKLEDQMVKQTIQGPRGTISPGVRKGCTPRDDD